MTPAIFYRRVVHVLDRNTLPALSLKLWRRLIGRGTPPALEKPLPPTAPHPFDRAHGVDTGGFVAGESLAPGAFHTDYYAISPSTLAQAMDHLGVVLEEARLSWSEFTFVDLGSGKGRALLVASRFPFRKIVGVELSEELCRIARANLQSFRASWQRCREIDVMQGDASTIAFPDTPLVVFLYHPFLAPVLRRVLRNLESSVQRRPREVFLLYANPTYERQMERFPFLRLLWHYRLALSQEDATADLLSIVEERYALYRHTPAD